MIDQNNELLQGEVVEINESGSLVDSKHFEDNLSILGEIKIDSVPQGDIYEKTLHEKITPPIKKSIPRKIPKALENSKHRKNLKRKLNYNLRLKFPIIGKPSSTFAFIGKDGKSKLHYLIENDLSRERSPHTPMREADEHSGRNTYKSSNLLSNLSLWSGHLANITPEFKNEHYSHVFLLDKFADTNDKMDSLDKRIIMALHKNGVIPLTSSGNIINHHLT